MFLTFMAVDTEVPTSESMLRLESTISRPWLYAREEAKNKIDM